MRAGLVQVLEGHRVFPSLTVEDNLLIGSYAQASARRRPSCRAIYDVFPETGGTRHQPASRLSGGQQQILAVAQGMIANPDC